MLEDDKGGSGPDTGGNDNFSEPKRPVSTTEGANPKDTRQGKPDGGMGKGG